MLVITRVVGESIVIRHPGSTYLLTVLSFVDPNRVQINIAAAATLTESLQVAIELQRDESHRMSDDFAITVVDIRGLKVRFGIEAPREATVHRWESDEAIRRGKM